MRLWGRVVSGMMFFIAAIFAVVAIFVPEARREAAVITVILITAALFGIPALVRFFMSVTGDEAVLADGVLGSAIITALKPSAWRYNRQFPIVRFQLNVEAGGASYPVEIKQAVDPELLERLSPGMVVRVRVHRENHKNVVIDLAESRT
jgi:hypothetical protein